MSKRVRSEEQLSARQAGARNMLGKTTESIAQMPLEEVQKLVCELQAHHAELETQNAELRLGKIELQRARDEYRDLYDLAPAAFLTLDPEGVVLGANHTATVLLEVGREDLLHGDLSRLIVSADREIFGRHRRLVLSTGVRQTCEVKMETPSEAQLHVRLESVAFKNDREVHHRCRTAVIDITELKRAEAEHLRLEERLHQAEKMNALGQLTAGVAHEFNNLLVGVLGNSELLLSKTDEELSEQSQGSLESIRQCGLRAAALIQQLLTFSRKRKGKASVFDLNHELGEAEGMLQGLLGEHIILDISCCADPCPVLASTSDVKQAIVSIASNARDAMPGGGSLTIGTANVVLDDAHAAQNPEAQVGAHVELTVADTGCGMTRAVCEHVFEPFFTTKPPGDGTGLGLSTVYGTVTKAGGHVIVESEPDRGTIVRVYLPRAQEAVLVSGTADNHQVTPRKGGGETILVCDDADVVLGTVCQLLEYEGYRVLPASGGREALALAAAQDEPISVLLTDVVMPEMSGPELAAECVRQRPDLKVIFMSGYASIPPNTSIAEIPHAAYLQKPVRSEVLFQCIRNVLS